MKKQIWDIQYDNELDGDLYAISLVKNPANKLQFIALKDIEKNKVENFQIQLGEDKKRKILYGIVLRANQEIYREDENGDPFYIRFSADTIVKLSQDFFKKGFQNNSTFNHESNKELNDTTVVENWIVEDPSMDKSTHLGLKTEIGDWCIAMKLGENSWTEYVETGKAKGFSIDSFLKLKKVKMKSDGDHSQSDNNTMSDKKKSRKKMSVIKNIMNLFSSVKLAEIEVDGKTLTADEFTEGNKVYDENLEPFVGEFEYESKTIVTDSEGTIVSVTEVSTDEDQPVEEEVSMIDKIKADLNDKKIKMSEIIELSDGVGAYIELPVGEHIIDGKKYTVEEKSEGEGDNVYTFNVIVGIVPVNEESTEVEEVEMNDETVKMKSELENLQLKNKELEKELDGFKSKPIAEKLKASPINMTKIEVSTDSTLDVIQRILKNNEN